MTPPVGSGALVVLPTFNERESLQSVVTRTLNALPAAEVLIVDDASPDRTGDLADALADTDPRIHVLHRTEKRGLGSAYVAGFRFGLNRGFEVLVECDADGSHQPEQLADLITALTDDVALVIGTRWMPGGSVHNWSWYRKLISRAGTGFARFALKSRLRDMTSGMRAYRASALRALDLDTVAAQGYGFQVELAWRLEQLGMHVREVPIDFVERAQGRSKMSFGIVFEALRLVTVWGWQSRVGGRRARAHAHGRGNRI